MQVWVDATTLELPAAGTIAEVLDAVAPHVDPARELTGVEVDGHAVDPTDRVALSAWRLSGTESIRLVTESPDEFARSRRATLAEYLRHVGGVLEAAAAGLRAGDATEGNRLLATGSHDLGLVLELDASLAQLDATVATCGRVVAALERCGERLTLAGREQRWGDVAAALEDELLPAIRATLA